MWSCYASFFCAKDPIESDIELSQRGFTILNGMSFIAEDVVFNSS
jgi:hypothetical protein